MDELGLGEIEYRRNHMAKREAEMLGEMTGTRGILGARWKPSTMETP